MDVLDDSEGKGTTGGAGSPAKNTIRNAQESANDRACPHLGSCGPTSATMFTARLATQVAELMAAIPRQDGVNVGAQGAGSASGGAAARWG